MRRITFILSSGAISPQMTAAEATRWSQLIFGIICMVMISNLQYGWTLFVDPINQKYHWDRAAIQVAFTIFALTDTWLVPFEGYLIDRFGPRIVVSVSGVLVAIAWAINSVADSLFLLYLGAAIGGIGAGAIYGGCVGNALKWFTDRRGLAAGLTAAGFGAGSALTLIPIANMIQSSGYESAFLWFGLGQGIVVVLIATLLRAPSPSELPVPTAPAVEQTRRDYRPVEVLASAPFWVMYANVRDGQHRRPDGNGTARPHRQGFQDRHCPGLDPGADAASAAIRAVARPRAQRGDASALRLGLRPDRS